MGNKTFNILALLVLLMIGVGIWTIILQNMGIVPTAERSVFVEGGNVDALVYGSVDIDNTVDVNIDAINGSSSAFYDFGGNGDHVRIPVYTGY